MGGKTSPGTVDGPGWVCPAALSIPALPHCTCTGFSEAEAGAAGVPGKGRAAGNLSVPQAPGGGAAGGHAVPEPWQP